MYQLSQDTIHESVVQLCKLDAVFTNIHERVGTPPLWVRPQSFATLVHIILEQKVSLASANAIMNRVRVVCPSMQESRFLQLPEDVLRGAGLSASKVAYCRAIASALQSGELSLARLRGLPDEEVINALTAVRGVGPWTAGVYLMMALRRADAWASGDRALVVSYAECVGLAQVPTYAELDKAALSWRPHRGTAARLLWHSYLLKRQRIDVSIL